jgi:phosphate transport system substrate-binding protein
MKKTIAFLLALALLLGLFALAGADEAITVVSREDGSGTRGAFIELMGVEQVNAEGNKEDMTTVEAEITNSTSVMLTSVAGNPSAIGYVSLGSLNDSVKALAIDGAQATVENIKSGEYKISRPFNIVLAESAGSAAQAFVQFILSAEGQAVAEEAGYISAGEPAPFSGSAAGGKIVVAGSSSVTPVMEKLKEAYTALNPNAEIEIQQSDSTTGINSTLDGICDIGMASRALKESELEAGLSPIVIAIDGIAVIANLENPAEALTSDQVRSVYTGEITNWSELNG